MAYDEDLANRLRELLSEESNLTEQRMFGGLAFLIGGQTGRDPIFQGAADFDLELVENRTLDRHIQELVYRPTLH